MNRLLLAILALFMIGSFHAWAMSAPMRTQASPVLQLTPTARPTDTIVTNAQFPVVRKSGATPTAAPPTYTLIPIPSSTPSNTTTSTSTPIPPMLQNGDFEQGKVAWIEDGGIVTEQASLAHRGSWFALLGSSGGSNKLTQRFLVPEDTPVLTFWYATSSDLTSCDIDRALIWIDPYSNSDPYSDTIIKSFDEFCTSRQHTYQQYQLDLSTYAGRVIEFQFDMYKPGADSSFLRVDDLAFAASPATATPTALPKAKNNLAYTKRIIGSEVSP